MHREAAWILFLQPIQCILQKDIFDAFVSEKKFDPCFVVRIGQYGNNHLEHGRNASATSNHGDIVHSIYSLSNYQLTEPIVNYVSHGPLHFNGIPYIHCVKILRELSTVRKIRMIIREVNLDNELNSTKSSVQG